MEFNEGKQIYGEIIRLARNKSLADGESQIKPGGVRDAAHEAWKRRNAPGQFDAWWIEVRKIGLSPTGKPLSSQNGNSHQSQSALPLQEENQTERAYNIIARMLPSDAKLPKRLPATSDLAALAGVSVGAAFRALKRMDLTWEMRKDRLGWVVLRKREAPVAQNLSEVLAKLAEVTAQRDQQAALVGEMIEAMRVLLGKFAG